MVDMVSIIQTLTNPCVSTTDKTTSTVLFIIGLLSPGGGYSIAASSTQRLLLQYTLSPLQWLRNIGIMRKVISNGINVHFGWWAEAGYDTIYVNLFMKNTALYEEYLHARHFMRRGISKLPKNSSLSAMLKISEYYVWLYSHEVKVKDALLRSNLPSLDRELLLKSKQEYLKLLNEAVESVEYWKSMQ